MASRFTPEFPGLLTPVGIATVAVGGRSPATVCKGLEVDDDWGEKVLDDDKVALDETPPDNAFGTKAGEL